MAYIAQKRLIVLSTGDRFSRGAVVGDNVLPPALMARMIREGVLVPYDEGRPERAAQVSREDVVEVVDATDAAVRLAEGHDIDLSEVEGQGAGGRILLSDIRALVGEGDDETED